MGVVDIQTALKAALDVNLIWLRLLLMQNRLSAKLWIINAICTNKKQKS